MATKREVSPLHEIAKIEYRFKFFYFLRDLGIKSAVEPAQNTIARYMDMLADLTLGG